MMDERNPVRRDVGDLREGTRSSRMHAGRSRPRIRGLVWGLLLLPGLVLVASHVPDWTGMRNSRSARSLILGEHAGPLRSVEFVRGTSNLVSLDTTGESWLWDTTTRRVLSSIEGLGARVSSQALDPRGRTLATGGRDGTLAFCDLATGERQILLTSDRGPIRAVAFSGDGETLALAEEDLVILVDRSTRRPWCTLQGEHGVVTALSFSPDGRTLASVARDLTITLWDHASGRVRATLRGHSDHIYGIAFAPDGLSLASTSADGSIRLWDVAGHRTRGILKDPLRVAFVVAFSPDGTTLATGHGSGLIVLWDAETLERRTTLQESGGHVRALAFSPDGRTLASGGSDSMVRLWELAQAR